MAGLDLPDGEGTLWTKMNFERVIRRVVGGLEAEGEQKRAVDWELLGDYLALFQLESKLAELKEWYGTVE